MESSKKKKDKAAPNSFSRIEKNVNEREKEKSDPVENSSSSSHHVSERPNRLRKTRLFQCPLCGGSFPASDIEQHASQCLEINSEMTGYSSSNSKKERKNNSNRKHVSSSQGLSKSTKKNGKTTMSGGM